MKVILLNDVENLGLAGDIVNVKPGYARNRLIPQGFALRASNKNVAVASQEKRILLKKKIVNSEKNEIYNDFYSNGNNFALEKLLGKKNSVIKI